MGVGGREPRASRLGQHLPFLAFGSGRRMDVERFAIDYPEATSTTRFMTMRSEMSGVAELSWWGNSTRVSRTLAAELTKASHREVGARKRSLRRGQAQEAYRPY